MYTEHKCPMSKKSWQNVDVATVSRLHITRLQCNNIHLYIQLWGFLPNFASNFHVRGPFLFLDLYYSCRSYYQNIACRISANITLLFLRTDFRQIQMLRNKHIALSVILFKIYDLRWSNEFWRSRIRLADVHYLWIKYWNNINIRCNI